MRNRSGIQGVASSPVIVGAVTVLVVIVAVFLAYNANNGLPFVSTYNLKARVPNANALVKGNEVRIGGARVGVVKSVVPVQTGNGQVAAELSLSLDKNVEPLPVNSTMIIRPKSPLGLKYLQIVPGNSKQGFAAGETIPVRAARPEPVDIDQFFDMFDEKTRKAIQRNLAGFGNAFAGRGPQINNAFAALRLLVEDSEPTLATLVAPQTGFGDFWRALEALSATVAPVAEEQASMFAGLDRTFAAFARVSRPFIQETIAKGPRTLDAASPTLNAQLPPTADALLAFQESTGVFNGLDLLIDTNDILAPAIRFIGPAQTTCNYLSLAFRNLASSSGEDNGLGGWFNATTFQPPEGPNSEAGAASAPANSGPELARGKFFTNLNHLHSNPYPNTAAPGQPKECEAGNEHYELGVTRVGNTPGNDGIKTAEQSKKQLGKTK
jgi:ABC-type transporter Mla subunit MlaD